MRTPIWFVVLILVCSRAELQGAPPRPWLFVSLLEDRTIVAYQRDAMTGSLQKAASTVCAAEPGVMCVSPDRRTLFVAMRSTGQLASFRIQPRTGRLERLSLVEGGEDPCYLLVDERGRYLLTAYYVSNQVTIHKVSESGQLDAVVHQTVKTGQNAHGLASDDQNRMVFVPHTGANRIFHFRFDRDRGRLTPSQPPFVTANEGEHPRHIAMHPSHRWVYANNEAGDSLSAYRLDRQSATLESFQTLSTLPDDFDAAKNTTARCEMTPDGRFIYVANRGHHSIAGFRIDPATGRLRSLGQTPTEATPRSFTIAPNGKFLYAAGQDSGRLASYSIGDSGQLKPERIYEVGPTPWCVYAFDVPSD